MSDQEQPLSTWIRGRVVGLPDNRCFVVLGGVEHVIDRDQAIALGTRLLEVGIGTTFHDERAINAKIGDLVCEARSNRSAR